MRPIRVILVDDHTLIRVGVRTLLQQLAGIEIVAEASNGREALQAIQTHQPDVVLMDIGMASLNGLEATARVTKDYPMVRVIILSMHATEEYVWQALRVGAAGYLLKDTGIAELEVAIQAVVRGETYLTSAVSKQVIQEYMQRVGTELSPMDRLTPRQREILQLIAEGDSTKEIAWKLNLSVKTVETHRTQMMERLGIYDIAGLVRYAMRMGLASLDT